MAYTEDEPLPVKVMSGGGGGGSGGSAIPEATDITGGRTAITAATPTTLIPASATARGIWLRNAGGEDVRYQFGATGADGTGDERVLLPGESRSLPYTTKLAVQVYVAANGSTVEWETWS